MKNKSINWEEGIFTCSGEEIGYTIGKPEAYSRKSPICLMVNFDRKQVFSEPVASEFSNALVSGGATFICFPGKWSDLKLQRDALRKGIDTFVEMDERINSVVEACLESKFYNGERIILIGCSRFGFACLHAMAGNLNIDSAVAILPVTYWPWLEEFKGLESNLIVRKHDLVSRIENFIGREIFLEITQDDDRVNTQLAKDLSHEIRNAFSKAGNERSLTVIESPVKGHNWTNEINGDLIKWFRDRRYIE